MIPIGRLGKPHEVASVVEMLVTNVYLTNKCVGCRVIHFALLTYNFTLLVHGCAFKDSKLTLRSWSSMGVLHPVHFNDVPDSGDSPSSTDSVFAVAIYMIRFTVVNPVKCIFLFRQAKEWHNFTGSFFMN